MSPRKKRFWILENAGEMKFTLENNDIQPNSRLTISGFMTSTRSQDSGYLTEAYIK